MRIIYLIVVLVAIPLIYPAKNPITDFDPRIDDWYKIEDWEVEVCQKWGGLPEALQIVGTSVTQDVYISQLTVSVQAQKTAYSFTNEVLYEVSYYIQPFKADIEVAIRLANLNAPDSDPNKYYSVQGRATASSSEGVSNYRAFQSANYYDVVQVRYQGIDGNGTLTVPIIDSANGYYQVPQNRLGSSSGLGGQGSDDWTNW